MIIESPIPLFIETSTEVCSIAISSGDKIVGSKVEREPKSHARIAAPLVNTLLKELQIEMSNIDAVVVSEGPGSYTGLRVGVSLAKGLCYGASKPLIAVGSLDLLANLALEEIRAKVLNETEREFLIAPMIDARRMEVYTSLYNSDNERLESVKALIVDENSFKNNLEKGLLFFCGDGSSKVRDVIKHTNAKFIEIESLAQGMLANALKKFQNKEFEDIAYFEPFYLKDFIAGTPKKKGII